MSVSGINGVAIHKVACLLLIHVAGSYLRYSSRSNGSDLVRKIKDHASSIDSYADIDTAVKIIQEVISDSLVWLQCSSDKNFQDTVKSKIDLMKNYVNLVNSNRHKKVILASTFRSHMKEIGWFNKLLKRYKYDSTEYTKLMSS